MRNNGAPQDETRNSEAKFDARADPLRPERTAFHLRLRTCRASRSCRGQERIRIPPLQAGESGRPFG
jgi:hypothetical protein